MKKIIVFLLVSLVALPLIANLDEMPDGYSYRKKWYDGNYIIYKGLNDYYWNPSTGEILPVLEDYSTWGIEYAEDKANNQWIVMRLLEGQELPDNAVMKIPYIEKYVSGTDWMGYASYSNRIIVPESVNSLDIQLCLENAKSLKISPKNKFYAEIRGDYYSKKDKVLLWMNTKKNKKSLGGGFYSIEHSVCEIPEGIKGIGPYAFDGDDFTLVLPKSLEWIDPRAFGNDFPKETVITEGNKNFVKQDGILYTSDFKNAILADLEVSEKVVVMPDAVENIYENAFANTEIYDLTLSSSLKVIYKKGLSNMGLRNTFPESLKIIEDKGVEDSSFYDGLYIPGSIEYIGNEAISKCNMKQAVLGEGIKAIPDGMFFQCDKLQVLELPDSIETIGVSAFENCNNIEKLDMPENLKKISFGAFWGLVEITEVDLPDGLESIGKKSFGYCQKLKQINIPNTVNDFGDDVFYKCDALQIDIDEDSPVYDKVAEFYGGLITSDWL